jgi:hypothetical protein
MIENSHEFQIQFVDSLSRSVKNLSDFSVYDLLAARLVKLCGQCGLKLDQTQLCVPGASKTKFVFYLFSKMKFIFINYSIIVKKKQKVRNDNKKTQTKKPR